MGRRRPAALVAGAIVTSAVLTLAQGTAPAVRQIRANGADLSYVEQGQGTPVVFVHGAVGDHRYWEPQREAFAKAHRYLSYSFRYHGAAPWLDDGKGYTTETHAADLAAFIKALGSGPVHLVGLSYGGVLAAMVALEHPSLVRSLTLAEPGLFSVLAETSDGKMALDEWMKGSQPMVAAIKAGDLKLATRRLTTLVTGAPAEEFDKLPAGFRQVLLDNARTLPLLLAAPPVTLTCEMLRGIKVPTLLVRGARTPNIFVVTNRTVGQCIAGSRLVVIPDASHAMSYDNPEAFNREVLRFLARPSLP